MSTVSVLPRVSRSRSSDHTARYIARVVNWQVDIHPRVYQPPTDVYETENNFVIRIEIAGMKNGEFSVSIEQNMVTVSGIRPDSTGPCAYYQMEIHYGEFGVQVDLPDRIDADNIEAFYEDGILEITLPKTQPKRIPIRD